MAPSILPPPEHITGDKQNIKVDIPSKISDSDMGRRLRLDEISSVSSAGDVMCTVKGNYPVDHSLTSEQYMGYPWANYYGYHYPSHYILAENFDDHKNIHANNEFGSQCPVVQSEDGLLMILAPGYQSGFCPYSTCIPTPTFGIDEPYAGPQFYTPPIFSSGYFPTPIAEDSGLLPSHAWDPAYFVGTDMSGRDCSGTPNVIWPNNIQLSQTNNLYTYPDYLLSFDMKNTSEMEASSSLSDFAHDTDNHLKDATKGSRQYSTIHPDAALAKSYYPHTKSASYHHKASTYVYPSGHVHVKLNGRGCNGNANPKNKNMPNDMIESCFSTDLIGRKTSPGDAVFSDSEDSSGNIVPYVVNRDHYNRSEFPIKYDGATFFVIKSYSEDDVHKSIKYNVWASTSDGNRKLDGAYNGAQRSSKCFDGFPVFLFFSVNGSGQFCGVAEMSGYVDFSRKMDFWQQDKWNGFFPVKWHIIKDVPNLQLRHILLENNDNKPVTNSRDTQEVGFPQGMEMLRIFKNYTSRTSILDDFGFYESRQKVMQDRRVLTNLPFSYQFKVGEEAAALMVENISVCRHQNGVGEVQIGGDKTP